MYPRPKGRGIIAPPHPLFSVKPLSYLYAVPLTCERSPVVRYTQDAKRGGTPFPKTLRWPEDEDGQSPCTGGEEICMKGYQ